MYLFERLAAAVLWFDPVVHLAARASETWREIACDASAAREAGGRICASALWRSAGALSATGGRSPALAATVAVALLATTASAVAVVRAPAYGSAGTPGLRSTGSMHTRRASFASVKLRDGRVLVAGGWTSHGVRWRSTTAAS